MVSAVLQLGSIQMIGMLRVGAAIIVAFLVLSSEATAQCAAPTGMTGFWTANDGGTYIVRRLGRTVWWVGESADDGFTFTNVFRGTLQSDNVTIVGDWADMVRVAGSGSLTLRIIGKLGQGVHGFDKIGSSGDGFGGEHWFMKCDDTNSQPQ